MDPIERLASSMPRWLFAGIVIFAGTALLLLINPPHTVCNSQYEVFKEQQTPFLYLDTSKSYIKTTDFQKAYDNCVSGNSLGSCGPLFVGIQRLMSDLFSANPDCHSDLYKKREVKEAFHSTLSLIVRIAWGNEPPESVYEKYRWLNKNNLYLYCRLVDNFERFDGKDAYANFRENIMLSLPNPANLPRAEVWRRSLFSTNCQMI